VGIGVDEVRIDADAVQDITDYGYESG
jgi:hypothetical protein